MRNYWTCSRFADWLRGTPKPRAETSKGWRVWTQAAKDTHPIRYWLAEEGLDHIQNFVMFIPDQIYAAKYYINNRYITRTHALTAGPLDIKPGAWMDVGYRFLPCLFNELRNFVEIELAWWHLCWEDRKQREKYNMPWWASGWWRIRTWRCPQAGLDNLTWQMNLTYDEDWIGADDPRYGQPTPQAQSAREIYELYTWWTQVYPNRPDPYTKSGWSEICDRRREEFGSALDWEDETAEQKQEVNRSLDLIREIEEQYEAEDEAMLIRLIKIRKALWT